MSLWLIRIHTARKYMVEFKDYFPWSIRKHTHRKFCRVQSLFPYGPLGHAGIKYFRKFKEYFPMVL